MIKVSKASLTTQSVQNRFIYLIPSGDCTQAEIRQLDVLFKVEQDIFRFQIPVSNPSFVKVGYCRYQLGEKFPHFGFRKVVVFAESYWRERRWTLSSLLFVKFQFIP